MKNVLNVQVFNSHIGLAYLLVVTGEAENTKRTAAMLSCPTELTKVSLHTSFQRDIIEDLLQLVTLFEDDEVPKTGAGLVDAVNKAAIDIIKTCNRYCGNVVICNPRDAETLRNNSQSPTGRDKLVGISIIEFDYDFLLDRCIVLYVGKAWQSEPNGTGLFLFDLYSAPESLTHSDKMKEIPTDVVKSTYDGAPIVCSWAQGNTILWEFQFKDQIKNYVRVIDTRKFYDNV